jgi:hypothetical protein
MRQKRKNESHEVWRKLEVILKDKKIFMGCLPGKYTRYRGANVCRNALTHIVPQVRHMCPDAFHWDAYGIDGSYNSWISK